MSVLLSPNHKIKHFNAVCTVSRWCVAEAFSRATAKTASTFIEKLIAQAPFKISRIQVDDGSEFMADFENACDRHAIELYVLAPKSPKLNGNVERLNGTWRSDFYEQYSLPHQLDQLQPLLQDFQDDYNFDRPHDAITLQTPYERLEELRHSDAPA